MFLADGAFLDAWKAAGPAAVRLGELTSTVEECAGAADTGRDGIFAAFDKPERCPWPDDISKAKRTGGWIGKAVALRSYQW